MQAARIAEAIRNLRAMAQPRGINCDFHVQSRFVYHDVEYFGHGNGAATANVVGSHFRDCGESQKRGTRVHNIDEIAPRSEITYDDAPLLIALHDSSQLLGEGADG